MNANHDVDDRVTTALSALPAYDVDPARAAQILERCRAGMPARESGRKRRARGITAPLWRRVLEPALVAGLSVVFLAEVLSRALRLEGF